MKGKQTKTFNLAYVLWRFPTLSETFILRRMVHLKQQMSDLNFNLYSIKKPQDHKIQELARDFVNPDIYVTQILSLRFVFSVFVFFVFNPVKVLTVGFQLLKEKSLRNNFPGLLMMML